jgi:SPP1 gp7 family putative phage head morphogenesis protein
MVLSVLALDKSFTDTLAGKGLEAGIRSFRDAIQSTYASGATAGITKLPSTVATDLSFNLMSRESVQFLENYEFGLIQGITDQAKDSIRQIIIRAFQEGGAPAKQARQIRDVIGLTPSQEQAVASFRDSLASTDKLTNALGRALRDGRYDRTLEAHRAAGTVPSETAADKMVSRYAERFVNHRATTIARTESVRASNMGQRQVWDQAQKQGLLAHDQQRVWITSGDDRTCEICEELDGETAGLNEEFDAGIMEPPDPHPDCRCTTALA